MIEVLPNQGELQALFAALRAAHFPQGLPEAWVEWSTRMSRSAGLCYPDRRLIRLSLGYFRDHPQDLEPVLLHEMIHLLHRHHDRAFKREAARVGALLRARAGGSSDRLTPWRWLARCPICGQTIPYRSRRRFYCASCRDAQGSHPALVYERLPGDPTTPAAVAEAVAALRRRRRHGPERVRLSPRSAGG